MRKKLASAGICLVLFAVLFGLIVPVQGALTVIQGAVYDVDGATPAPDGVSVIVTDLDTGDSLSTTTLYSVGFYAVTFGWPGTPNDVTPGDQIQIVADDGAGKTNTTTVTASGASPQVVNLVLEDHEPPVISNVISSSITETSAAITWDTNEVSDSLVKYGMTSGVYTMQESDATDVTSHSVDLTGLTQNTTYYYVVNSTDPSDYSAESAEYSFTTPAGPDTTKPTTAVTAPELPGEPSPIPTEHQLDWTNSPVMLSFLRTDASGVAYTNFSTTSGEGAWTTVNDTTAIGPDAGLVSDNITELTFNVTVSDTTTIWYYSVDKNETPNQETTKNLTVRIDTIPPGTVTNLNDTDASWTWIQWNWTNPDDPSLDHVEVWLGAFNATTTGESYRAEGLVPDTTYTINVRAVDVAGNKGAWQNDTADTLVDEEAPVVTVTAPDGGEVWTIGTQQEINWTATDNAGVDTIDIAYSTDGGANYTDIAVGEANDGTYTWTIPDDPSTNCRVKVVAHDVAGLTGEDESDANFTIELDTADPTVTVTAPDGGETWGVGFDYEIRWNAIDNVGVTEIDIYYSTDGGANYTDIAVGEANNGTYTWTVPNDQSTTCKVKVVAHDAALNTGEDESDANFTIADTEDPVVTVTAPTEGATFTTATITVSGTATDNVEVTSIEVNGVPVAITPGQNVPFSTSVTLATGANTITVVATDSNNNTGTRKVNVTYSPRRVGGGSRGPALDTDGDGYSDIVEWLQGSDETNPCDPDPNSEACLALGATPAPATPTPATPKPTVAVPPPVTTPTTKPPAATPTPTPEEPGFGAVFAIAGLLAVAYLVLRRKQE